MIIKPIIKLNNTYLILLIFAFPWLYDLDIEIEASILIFRINFSSQIRETNIHRLSYILDTPDRQQCDF